MLSLLYVKCSACDSIYKLFSEETNVVVLFKCVECGEYSVYVSGHVLPLDGNIMDQGTDGERLRHVVEILHLWACEFAGNVLKNVDRVIDVDVGVIFRDTDLDADCSGFTKLIKENEESSGSLASKFHPTILREDASGITDEDVRDFIRIDLNLIDKKSYFNRFFGKHDR